MISQTRLLLFCWIGADVVGVDVGWTEWEEFHGWRTCEWSMTSTCDAPRSMSDLASFPVSAPTTRTRTEDPSPISCTDRPARATSARKSPRSPSSGMVHETHPATISSLRAVTSATCAAFSSAPASDAGGAARGICRAAAPRCLMVTGRRVRRRAPHGRCARDIAASAARWTDAAMDTRSGERVDRACSRRASRSGDAVVYLLGDKARGNYPRTW